MDSDEDLPLTRSTVFRTKVYCPILGSIVDGILKNDDLGQQNSGRNVVDHIRKTETKPIQ